MKTDSQLQAEVLDELQADVSIAASGIGVAVRVGAVTLSGFVTSVMTRSAAVRASQR